MWRSSLTEFLDRGLRVTTTLDDGSFGAEFVLQPDGDVINRVSSAFLSDAAAQRRHADGIRASLAPLRRLRTLTKTIVPTAGTAVTGWLALHHHMLPAAVSLASLTFVAVQWARRAFGRRPPM